jgi:hypothetical protein
MEEDYWVKLDTPSKIPFGEEDVMALMSWESYYNDEKLHAIETDNDVTFRHSTEKSMTNLLYVPKSVIKDLSSIL